MKNNLSEDSSPYLQQHKNNPVHWQRWNKETLSVAKNKKKPILLSIGYASCHWCHVMAHESFEDNESADLMNKLFINIKVDREERPDIDFVFQSSFQLFNRSSGGWPLTMFLDEDGVPFMGGTYFPKISKNGIPSFKEVLKKVSEAYNSQREEILKQKQIIKKNLELKKNSIIKQDLEPFLDILLPNLDSKLGGYKGAPKFPHFNTFSILIHFYKKNLEKKYLDPVELLLKQLCSKGIYDHVEGGISRYTIDENWLIPHFEKMLYDNAQFISLLSKFVSISPSEYFKKKIIQTVKYFHNNFKNKENLLLGSAFDADSEGEEGKYYIFHYDEISKILGIKDYFHIEQGGNWEGKIILKEKKAEKTPPQEIIDELHKIRKKRVKPFFDDKTQLDLNCLWVSALVNANKVLPNQNYLKEAEDLFEKIDNYFLKKNICHSNSKSRVFLEDYAYTINALLDLYEVTFKQNYRVKAHDLCKETISK